MKPEDIKIGEYYRHKQHPDYAWAKVIRMIPPKTAVNIHTYPIFECEWSVRKDDTFGMFKYFKASDLVKPQ